ncbi:MAG: 4-alpha-glucanotransferase [Gemmatimonadetes bacterium]|uniref:4-alpha-glucanotransferase n=1 Tax=Candidatus Kutchimonas denitrificans TaxID=3056748 RepID=A0AAE4ZA58_9BACT|nr:4-alpha-glucanotransferase [Gemmatimonadota bacterium]NIR76614.1 4-alpha-glucanotransferase [Candidatus Kutchimonas denitrificans]NIS03383.1 4-alpha-glucanotransferase [Gemmatimonadota bacterium]NIT69244.1 4-alpha-glucanotransferase [Gemmatimonadota bacterium]NIU54716.1 4-alpha-glucanotransferase [Gemmatimonadota bacterium]
MGESSALVALAERMGILSAYVDNLGESRRTPDDTRVALLAALGIDASNETAAARALESVRRAEMERILEPVHVWRRGGRSRPRLRVRPPPAAAGAKLDYALEITEEGGRTHRSEGRLSARGRGDFRWLELPGDAPPGYHRVRLEIDAAEAQRAKCRYIVAPRRCLTIAEKAGPGRRFGIWEHLYAVRSRRNWGVGDLTDLSGLVDWAASLGAAFVGINPLHALRNAGSDISPYGPVSRTFRNIIYLDVEAVPELSESAEAQALIRSSAYQESLAGLRAAGQVDYERVMSLKSAALESLHRTFAARHRDRATERGEAYAGYLEAKGVALQNFATFQALAKHFAEAGLRDPRRWPEPYRDSGSEEVARFRREHFEAFDFHRYVQFEIDRQLGNVGDQAARRLPLGTYGDLAIGTAADGCDPWAFAELFAPNVHLGAPPDDYSTTGQDWGLPPLNPFRLREDGYRYWARLLQSNLEHVGALRIDHVMGLFRQFWIPAGRPATEGAYIRFPAQELLGVLALESHRNGAIVIGEDLGTVPPGLSARLARWGILSCSVLYFERDRRGNFPPARGFSKRALVTVDTHDHPPLASLWTGHDLSLARRVGLIESDERLGVLRLERESFRRALLRRLAREGCLPKPEDPGNYSQLCAAVHAFLSKTPSPLVGVWLSDLTGEVDPLNVPGIGLDRYPNWSRRLSMALEELIADRQVAGGLSGLRSRRVVP